MTKLLTDGAGNTKWVRYGANPNITDVNYTAQYNTNGVAIDESCNAGITTNCNFDPETLSYLVYYPVVKGTTTDLRNCKLPTIILFHAGGFSDCKQTMEGDHGIYLIAQQFAKRGYVAFVVEYRTGRWLAPKNLNTGQSYLTAQQSLAQYRAFQDARGAVRSIIKHQKIHDNGINFLNDPYQIDTNKIFLGGNSAGSIMAIQTAYYSAAQIAQVFPTVSTVTAADALGPIDINNYYGEVSNEPDLRVVIKGVMNMWGQALYPKNTTLSAFRANNPAIPPMIAFHGKLDSTLPIDSTPIIFAPNKPIKVGPKLIDYSIYNSESNCLLSSPYRLDPNETTPDLNGNGSFGIYKAFNILGKSIELHVDCQMEHGLDDTSCTPCGGDPLPNYIKKKNGTCVACTYDSDFGTGLQTEDLVDRYMVQRATTFFQAVITGQDSGLTRDLFIECENKRVKSYPASTLADNPLSCPQPSCTLP